MRERVDLKSPVRENRPPGSVRGAPGNRRPYRDNKLIWMGVFASLALELSNALELLPLYDAFDRRGPPKRQKPDPN